MKRSLTDRLDDALNASQQTGAPRETVDLVRIASALRDAGASSSPPSPDDQRALATMRASLASARASARETPKRAPAGWFTLRPAFAQVAAVVLVAGAVLGGASLAGADITSPIRQLFEQDKEAAKVTGIISAVDADSLTIETDAGPITVAIESETEIVDESKAHLDLEDLEAGQAVEVKGEEQPDGSIAAARIRVGGN